MKTCKKCLNPFQGKRCLFCHKRWRALYLEREDVKSHLKDYYKKYRSLPEKKIKEKARSKTEKRKQQDKEYRIRPENKIKRKNYLQQIEVKNRLKDLRLIKTYNINLDQYNDLLVKQNNSCAGCGIHELECRRKTLCVDHDHKTRYCKRSVV